MSEGQHLDAGAILTSPPMVIVLSAFAFVFLAREITLRFARQPMASFERVTAWTTIGIAAWLGCAWLLALTHVLLQPLIYVAIVAVLSGAVWLARVRPVRERFAFELPWIGAVPVALWSAFALWRGWIVPPLSHDALAYHLPKAALYARAHGFESFDFLDAIVRQLPANYEMLVAWVFAAEWRDTTTEWLSVSFYIAFVIASVALAERWWRAGKQPLAALMLFVAGVPVLLLHAGAHKNDVLTAFAMVAMMVWCGRWVTTGERFSLVLLILAMGIGVGTKPQSGLLAIVLAACALWRAVRDRMRARTALGFAAFGVVAFLLLGGFVYVHDQLLRAPGNGQPVATFGDWANLWQAWWVLLAAPFSRSAIALDVPWASTPWFWRRYELYFSHLGIPFVFCAVAALLIHPVRKRVDGEHRERLAMSAAAFIALLAMLPVNGLPHGMYLISLPRYALFIVPVVFAWTVAPLAVASRRTGAVLLACALASFAWYAYDFTLHDVFVPWDYVKWARVHPGTRAVAFDPYRAASVLDRHAGPRDVVAVDAGFGAWTYPLFGADLQRPVIFLPQAATSVPDSAQWVAIDRRWAMMWADPEFKDLSQARRFLGRGRLSPDDVRLREALLRDARFEMVFDDRRTNQTVFRRRAPNP